MPKKASQQVNLNTVRNSSIALIEALATNAALSDDEIVPSLGKLTDGTLLAMFCVIRFWALDSFARLSGIGSVSDWKKQFEELGSQLPKVSKSDLSALALRTGDGTSLLLLATGFDALRMMAVAVERKLDPLPIGKEYVKFRDTSSEENLETMLQAISPTPLYYHIKGEPPEDREQDIYEGFLKFINRLQKTPVGNWEDFPYTVLGDHRPAPHPEWDKKAREFLKRDIEDTLKNELPILSGKLEDAPLQTRTVLRDKYKIWCPQITFRTTGEVVTPKNLDLEKIGPDKMQELGHSLNPEIKVGEKEEREAEKRNLLEIAKQDSELYFAWKKHKGNKSKIAGELGVSRPTLDKRLKKIRSKNKKLRD